MRKNLLRGAAVVAALAVFLTNTPAAKADLVTFANFNQTAPGNPWTFTTSTFPGTATFTASTQVDFTYLADPEGLGQVPLFTDFAATAVLSATTTAAALQFPVGGMLFDLQPINGVMNSLSFTRNSDSANLLTIRFVGNLSGLDGTSVASLTASTLAPGQLVTFTSDFIDFTLMTDGGMSLSFSSVTPVLGLNGPSGASFLRSFGASGTGTFDVELIPEPATVTLFAVGALGLVGYRWRQRRA